MEALLTVALTMLSVQYLTYGVVYSRLLAAPRDAVQEWAERRWLAKHPGEPENSEEWRSLLAYQLSCPWCVSPYVGAVVVAVTDLWVGLPTPVLVWLAAAGFTGAMLNNH